MIAIYWPAYWFFTICLGIITSGCTYGYYQRKYSDLAKEQRVSDCVYSIFSGIFTIILPFFIIIFYLLSERFKYKFYWPGSETRDFIVDANGILFYKE